MAIDLPASLVEGPPRLRLPTEADVERIADVCRDPEIGRFTTVPVPYTRDDAAWFVSFAAAALAEDRGVHLVVVDGRDVVQGAVGCSVDARDRVGVVGYWTAPEARGRGTTVAVARRLCRFALDELGLERLELDAAADNAGSNAVARRLGFTLEGTHRSAMLLDATGGRPQVRVDRNLWGLLPGELT